MKIKITSDSIPVLLLDDGTEVRFKDQKTQNHILTVLYSIEYQAGRTLEHVSKWKPLAGQTFELPDGVEVSFKEERYEESKEFETTGSFSIGFRKLAILTSEPAPQSKEVGQSNGWISVKDKLPNGVVLLFTSSGIHLIGDLYDGKWRVGGHWRRINNDNATGTNIPHLFHMWYFFTTLYSYFL